MKKIFAILLVVVLAMSMAACGKFTCDLCDEDKFGKKNTAEIFGQEIEYCNDCKEELEDFSNSLDGLFG